MKLCVHFPRPPPLCLGIARGTMVIVGIVLVIYSVIYLLLLLFIYLLFIYLFIYYYYYLFIYGPVASVGRVLLGGLASRARGWVAGCTGCLGVLPPWGVIAVAAPWPPGAPNLHFATCALNFLREIANNQAFFWSCSRR